MVRRSRFRLTFTTVTILVVEIDNKYLPDTLSLKMGDVVAIWVENQDLVEHDITVDELSLYGVNPPGELLSWWTVLNELLVLF